MNVLNLPRFKVLQVRAQSPDGEESDRDYLVVVDHIPQPQVCPSCGAVEPGLRRFGKWDQLFVDLPSQAKRVRILVHKQRYQCRECRSVFIERLPDMDDKRLMTRRLVAYIEAESLKRTHVSIADDVGVDEKTIRNVFRDYLQRLEAEHAFETPEWMGINEIKLVNRPRCIVTNLREQTAVELLRSRSKKAVTAYLSRLADRGEIVYVFMDVWRPYLEAVQATIPRAQVIIGKFHTVRMLNAALDTVRRDLRASLAPEQRRTLKRARSILLRRSSELNPEDQGTLEVWTSQFPRLGIVYRLKEEFLGIYDDATDSAEAVERCQEWREKVPDELLFAFQDMLTTLTSWETEIFAYFDAPKAVTDGYTETMNGVAKLTGHVGRGYSFSATRARLLYNKRFHVRRPANRRDSIASERGAPYSVHQPHTRQSSAKKTDLNFGVHIPTLIEEASKGKD